ncbi:MAG: ABC transporter substrate-binding protein, partial [Pseudorhodoplanes sp.]|nr:ABC transporter substrate-binding protein [Pseudorhodoplanes sp.]
MQSRLLYVALLAAALMPAAAQAQVKTKIGVLNDQSGVYADDQGVGSVIAAQLAVDDYAKKLGVDAEVVSGDHQNKVDIGTGMARRWFENEGIDVVMDVPNSAIALGVATIAKDLNKILIGSGAGTATLTGTACTPNTVHWTYDTWELGHSIARAVYQRGGKKWFFITADYVFGKDLEANASEEVKALGGEVVGFVRAPLGTSDYSSFLVQAQAAKPDVIALAVAGGDLTNAIKQAAEFGMTGKYKMPSFVFNPNNARAVGLQTAQGILAVNPWYWDANDANRAFSKRYAEKHPRKMMPNDMQAGMYSATVHYLKAVAALKSAKDGRAVVAKMKELPTDDPLFGKGTIRADGRKI